MEKFESAKSARDDAKKFCEKNIVALARDVAQWLKGRELPDDAPLRSLAAICKQYSGDEDSMQQAERIVLIHCCNTIAALPSVDSLAQAKP